MLDVECSVRGFPETYVQKVKVQHKDNRKLFEPKHCDISRTFGIVHFAGQVIEIQLKLQVLKHRHLRYKPSTHEIRTIERNFHCKQKSYAMGCWV